MKLAVVVGDDDTAIVLGSGEVPVLATPRLIALCERATLVALAGRMAPNETTVGMRVQIDHMQPTAVGIEVVAEAVLDEVVALRATASVPASV